MYGLFNSSYIKILNSYNYSCRGISHSVCVMVCTRHVHFQDFAFCVCCGKDFQINIHTSISAIDVRS